MNHIIQRARERYGLELTPDDVCWIKRAILRGRSVRLERKPNGSETHLVAVPRHNRVVKAVWIPATELVVTVVPERGRKPFKGKRRRRQGSDLRGHRSSRREGGPQTRKPADWEDPR